MDEIDIWLLHAHGIASHKNVPMTLCAPTSLLPSARHAALSARPAGFGRRWATLGFWKARVCSGPCRSKNRRNRKRRTVRKICGEILRERSSVLRV